MPRSTVEYRFRSANATRVTTIGLTRDRVRAKLRAAPVGTTKVLVSVYGVPRYEISAVRNAPSMTVTETPVGAG